jgi:hypothetical protein
MVSASPEGDGYIELVFLIVWVVRWRSRDSGVYYFGRKTLFMIAAMDIVLSKPVGDAKPNHSSGTPGISGISNQLCWVLVIYFAFYMTAMCRSAVPSRLAIAVDWYCIL